MCYFLSLSLQEGSSAADSLTDMQCMWYLTEGARAYMRRGQYGEALKKCHEIDRVSIMWLEYFRSVFPFHGVKILKVFPFFRGEFCGMSVVLVLESTSF